jgi:hypothetical protein
MKTNFFTLLALFFAASLQVTAAVFTVSNNNGTPAQYTTVAAAMKASNVGDTLYLHGSTTSYGDIYINKTNLTLIGAGYNPSKDNALSTIMGNIYLDTVTFNQTGRGAKLIGLQAMYLYSAVNGAYSGTYTFKNHGVVIDRCNFANSINISGDNWLIKNCYLGSVSINNHMSITITNNIFISGNSGAIVSSNQSSVMVTNNDFFVTTVFYGYGASTYNFSNGTFSNNIIYGGQMYYGMNAGYATNVAMNNNLTFNQDTLPTRGNFGVGNITNKDPLFVNVRTVTPISLSYDFRLTANSPARYNGNDKTDIGITGGSYPWFENTGTANLPEIKQLNISSVVPLNGNINIQVKAKQHN